MKNNYKGFSNNIAIRVIIFFVIAFVISNLFRFDIFNLNPTLKNNTQWGYLIISGILEGSGIFMAGLIGLFLLKKQKKDDISFLGSSKSKSLLMAFIPTILLIVIGVPNTLGVNNNIYGLIAAIGTIIYCILEEYGWRGYLQSEMQFLKPLIRFLVIGFIWYAWHLSFLTKASLLNNLIFLGSLILGSWGIGKVREITNSILACSCFHFIVNIFMFNHFFTNAFSGISKLVLLFVSVLIWVFLLINWNKSFSDMFKKNRSE